MTPRAYRNAVFRAVLRPLTERLSSYEAGVRDAALNSVSVKFRLTFDEIPHQVHAVYISDESDVSFAAVDILLLTNELHWFARGVEVGYFDDEDGRTLLEGVSERDEIGAVSRFAELLETELLRPEHEDITGFQRNMAIARDASTPELIECLRLLLFAGSSEWRSATSHLVTITNMMINDPSLSLPADSMDAVAWALSGADDIFQWLEAEDYYHLPIAMGPLVGYLRGNPDDEWRIIEHIPRLVELKKFRGEIAAAAVHLTDDSAAAAATRLAQTLKEVQGKGFVGAAEGEWEIVGGDRPRAAEKQSRSAPTLKAREAGGPPDDTHASAGQDG